MLLSSFLCLSNAELNMLSTTNRKPKLKARDIEWERKREKKREKEQKNIFWPWNMNEALKIGASRCIFHPLSVLCIFNGKWLSLQLVWGLYTPPHTHPTFMHGYREAPRLLPVTGHIALLGQTGGQCPLVCQALLQPMIKGCRAAKPRPPAPTPAVGDGFMCVCVNVCLCVCVSH